MDKQIHSIKSFAARKGRLSEGQKKGLSNTSHFNVDFDRLMVSKSPIHLEIGFGMGDSLFEMAQTHPNIHYIGVEVYPPGVGHLMMRCIHTKINNVSVYHGDVYDLLKLMPQRCLSTVYIYFPDPWHKRRHHKRRLINADFIQTISNKVIRGGNIDIVTDWADYHHHIEQVLTNNQYGQYVKLMHRSDRPITKYEKRAKRLGHQIYEHQFLII
ncbi:MAG: tRNA (guanosine(46)-N7)-methyltransferase TrmB [Legionellales bacterium]|nr:tRNA (guanosine(46)-N7)-methyltransferase TrmB [Legionellales bacterium]|tara:strand:+ start:4701 stop:5339 length:639 start_codon:yes stop_codon:yes gene_type:complete